MTLEIVVSGFLAVLLLLMIYSAWLLDRRLRALRDNGGELRKLIDGLNGATERAQAAIVQLKAAAKEFDGDWRDTVGKARALADELSLITQAGENLANRLTDGLTGASSKSLKPNKGADVAELPKVAAAKTENDVVRALRGVR